MIFNSGSLLHIIQTFDKTVPLILNYYYNCFAQVAIFHSTNKDKLCNAYALTQLVRITCGNILRLRSLKWKVSVFIWLLLYRNLNDGIIDAWENIGGFQSVCLRQIMYF